MINIILVKLLEIQQELESLLDIRVSMEANRKSISDFSDLNCIRQAIGQLKSTRTWLKKIAIK